jgi:hypothetical protein
VPYDAFWCSVGNFTKCCFEFLKLWPTELSCDSIRNSLPVSRIIFDRIEDQKRKAQSMIQMTAADYEARSVQE